MLLGRAAGLTEEKLAHIGDDPLPEGLYASDEAAIVNYARRSSRLEPIDDKTYGDLAAHFTPQQIIEIAMTVGLSNLVNRFHATFLTDVDPATNAILAPSCPLHYPDVPEGE